MNTRELHDENQRLRRAVRHFKFMVKAARQHAVADTDADRDVFMGRMRRNRRILDELGYWPREANQT